MASDPVTATLPDGAIRVQVGARVGTVSSWHLVPGKVVQLQRSDGQAFGTVADQPIETDPGAPLADDGPT